MLIDIKTYVRMYIVYVLTEQQDIILIKPFFEQLFLAYI